MARLTKDQAEIIFQFIIDLDLIPARLITPEVLKLIHYSWERDKVFEDLNDMEKQQYELFLNRLHRRFKKHPCKPLILDDMKPLNINPLFDNF